MIWAIVSDVHGRLDALALVLADARAVGAERVLNLGDVVSTAALDLFPSLDRSATARSAAFAALAASNIPLFLHGHTHVQLA